MLLIKAKFIGENGSLGYLKNGKYHLFFSITKSAQVQIKPIGDSGGKICRYGCELLSFFSIFGIQNNRAN